MSLADDLWRRSKEYREKHGLPWNEAASKIVGAWGKDADDNTLNRYYETADNLLRVTGGNVTLTNLTPDEAQSVYAKIEKNPAAAELVKTLGMRGLKDLSQQQVDRYSNIAGGLLRNGIAPTAEALESYSKQFTAKDGTLQDVDATQMDRRIQLGNLGYDTSGMVGRQVDQTWDTKTSFEQANPGQAATQANINQYQPAASASGTKDVNVTGTATKIGAQQLVEGVAGGRLPGGGGAPGNPPGGANLGTDYYAGLPPAGSLPNRYNALTPEAIGASHRGQLGEYRGAQSDWLNQFFPEFGARQAKLGEFATSLASELNTGYVPEGLKKRFEENIRSAQGVRGLGGSPLAAFDEAIGMSGLPEQYRAQTIAQLGQLGNIMGQPLTQVPGQYQGPSFGDVASLGLNVAQGQTQGDQFGLGYGLDVARNRTQNQQFNTGVQLGAAGDILEQNRFTEGMDAERNKPRPSFWENLGYSFAGGAGSALGGKAALAFT